MQLPAAGAQLTVAELFPGPVESIGGAVGSSVQFPVPPKNAKNGADGGLVPNMFVIALAKLPTDEAGQVGAWLVDIAKAVAGAAKTVKPAEQAAIDKTAALFTPTPA
jgi:hypothetical protein